MHNDRPLNCGVGASPTQFIRKTRVGEAPTPQRKVAILLIAVLSFVSFAHAQEKPATTQPAAAVDYGKPTDSLPKPGPRADTFLRLHQQFLDRIKSGKPIDVVFMGDSITAGWGTRGKDIWKKTYEPMNAVNFGIGGDQTQNVIWRCENGELDGIHPKVLVLMIGTNNTGKDSAEEIAAGVEKIVKTAHAKLPKTKILLLGVFPRAKSRPTTDQSSPPPTSLALHEKIGQINAIISKLDDGGKTVKYLDITKPFLNEKGELPTDTFADGLHPNTAGYQIWADAMAPTLAELMK